MVVDEEAHLGLVLDALADGADLEESAMAMMARVMSGVGGLGQFAVKDWSILMMSMGKRLR